MRLSEKAHWDTVYQEKSRLLGEHSVRRGWKDTLKQIIPRSVLEYMSSYDQYLLWEVIYPRYMPRGSFKALEVGSAPGHYLVKLSQRFPVEPFGVEYSDTGALLNRKVFELNRLDPNNVIHADFFSEDFQNRYAGFFDVVVSRGFIEHFSDVEAVIEKHVNLLKPGGITFITIPNYSGINYILQYLFNKKILHIHNLTIMNKQVFSEIFPKNLLDTLYCHYWGIFSFSLFASRNSMKRIQAICEKVQSGLNMLFRLAFRKRLIGCKYTSAHLMFIGQKRINV